jgi:hypothetical protein
MRFWEARYNARFQLAKLIAADESLACSKLDRLKGKALVIYYKREVPMKPIIEHLRERESSVVSKQVEQLRGEAVMIALKGDSQP